jgi:hypothetical protein
MESEKNKTLSASTLNESCINEFEVFIFNIPRAWFIHLLELLASLALFLFSLIFQKSKSIREVILVIYYFERVKAPI